MKAIYFAENKKDPEISEKLNGEYWRGENQSFEDFLDEAKVMEAWLEREAQHTDELKDGQFVKMYIVDWAWQVEEEKTGRWEVYYDEDDDWGTHTYSRIFTSWGEAKDWVDRAKKYSDLYNFDIVEIYPDMD